MNCPHCGKEIEESNFIPSPSETIPYESVINLYNQVCVSFPKAKLTQNRKTHIGARFKHYKGSFETFFTLFTKVEASDFLKGKNNRGWKANFDWLMNEANMAKVLEGNYDNKTNTFIDPPH